MNSQKNKKIIKKYKKNVQQIIDKYKALDDTYDDIIDLVNYEKLKSSYYEKISFLKNTPSKSTHRTDRILTFEDAYKRLCCNCDFYDICDILQ